MKKILIAGLLLLGLSLPVFAATENGITVTETLEDMAGSGLTGNLGQVYVKQATRFAAFSIPDGVAGTYIYNEASGTSTTAGSVNTKGLNTRSEILTVSTYTSGTISASIQFGLAADTAWYEAAVVTFTATGTKHVNIVEDADRVRIGWKKSGAVSTVISNYSSYKGNTK